MATSLSAFLQLNELSDEEVEEDDLLIEGKVTSYVIRYSPYLRIVVHSGVACGELSEGW